MTPCRDELLADAEPVEDFQRALGMADAARALPDAVGIVEQHDRNAAQAEIDRRREADRAGADHHDRVPRGSARVLVGRAAVGVLKEHLVLVAIPVPNTSGRA